MFKIGEFSKLTFISVRMLRFYDQQGLLKPRYIDKKNNYRYYDTSQLSLASRINSLKMLGFGIKEIKEIIDNLDDKTYRRVLEDKKKTIEKEISSLSQNISLIDYSLKKLGESQMKYDILLKTVPQKNIAYVHDVIDNYNDEGKLFNTLMKEMMEGKIEVTNPIYSGTIYYDEEYKEKDIELEAFIEINSISEDSELSHRVLPPQQIVSCIVKGSYDQFADVNKEIASWVEENNYQFSGPMFNIYYVSPGQTNNEDDYLTEVCYPVKEK